MPFIYTLHYITHTPNYMHVTLMSLWWLLSPFIYFSKETFILYFHNVYKSSKSHDVSDFTLSIKNIRNKNTSDFVLVIVEVLLLYNYIPTIPKISACCATALHRSGCTCLVKCTIHTVGSLSHITIQFG